MLVKYSKTDTHTHTHTFLQHLSIYWKLWILTLFLSLSLNIAYDKVFGFFIITWFILSLMCHLFCYCDLLELHPDNGNNGDNYYHLCIWTLCCTNHLKTVLCSVKEIFVIVFFLPFLLLGLALPHPAEEGQDQPIISVLD